MIRDPHLRRALAYVRPYAGALLPVVLLSTTGTALGLALPYLSKSMIDDAILGGDFPLLLRIVGLFIGITLLGFGANVASGMRYTRVSAGILFDMRLALYRHLQRLSPRFYARTPFGDIVSRINSDIGEIQRVTADAALGLFGNVLFLVGTVGMLVYLDARLFLAGLIALPPSLWALVRYRNRLEGRVTQLRERSADIGSFLIETLQGVRTVVASNAQEREAARFGRHNDRFVRALLSMRRYTYLAGGLPGVLLQTGTAAVFLYGGYRVITEATTLGTFVAFMAYQMRLLFPVQALMGLYANLASARASLVRVHELFDTPLEVVEAEGAERLGRASGALVLEDVRLGFGRGGEVLEGVSLEVAAGQVVALVGASGSGKSTVADLLSRQLDPDGGRVLLDGRDLRELALADVRRNVAVVEQDPFIFHASIAENVRYAKPDATDLEVAGALAAAALDGLMASLPEGAETVVGERGRQLSAGERQRVAVARAFLADPAVLVFDEATGALDPASEAQVLEGYAALMRGRTTVLITHRPELARRAERVVVLRDGRVAQDGRPAELDSRPGAFRALFAG
ncbi:ABC transporter ATP-binding protein [Candidatus Palauibacter polyketidifaciens]|uniref:ABC transporter ATP-binding protein n=1 Tax=Candidatus Palauibacter polyketidifaciens TaxID=3056740 RepID=UPI002392B850|nr:ABC transporter ATP-binding protein [Candidatus Palauibacter polyketidifaciens]MDE2720693.1 ABC transporter ATP-binding protein [Candidatus Palauibacter polyketidifaciens]